MQIAFYTANSGTDLLAHNSWLLTCDLIIQLAAQNPTDAFAVVGPNAIGHPGLPANLQHLPMEAPPDSLAGKWLYRRKLQKILAQWRTDLVINMVPGMARIFRHKQVLVLHTDWNTEAAGYFTGRPKNVRSKQLAAAWKVLVAWPWQAGMVQQQYQLPSHIVTATGSFPTDHFHPAGWARREEIKDQFAGGTEYFLYAEKAHGSSQVLELLKAFSTFKKRQRSNMRMVLAFVDSAPSGSLQQKLDTYKYRSDLVLLRGPNSRTLAELLMGSYALLANDSFWPGWWLAGSLHAEVPVMAAHQGTSVEALGDAGLYVEEWKADLLAEAMMLLYKDEAQRSSLIDMAKTHRSMASCHMVANSIWQAIQAN